MELAVNAKVFVVEDDSATRNALQLLLQSEKIPCVAYPNAETFLKECRHDFCGCMLVDIRLPGINGLQLQKIIIESQLPLTMIFITGHGDVSTAVQAMKQGALEFYEKPYKSDALILSIRNAMELGIKRYAERKQKNLLQNKVHSLTNREKQIFELIAQGKMNKMIASELNISIRTVEVHRAHIMEKLEAKSVSDIIHIAVAQAEAV